MVYFAHQDNMQLRIITLIICINIGNSKYRIRLWQYKFSFIALCTDIGLFPIRKTIFGTSNCVLYIERSILLCPYLGGSTVISTVTGKLYHFRPIPPFNIHVRPLKLNTFNINQVAICPDVCLNYHPHVIIVLQNLLYTLHQTEQNNLSFFNIYNLTGEWGPRWEWYSSSSAMPLGGRLVYRLYHDCEADDWEEGGGRVYTSQASVAGASELLLHLQYALYRGLCQFL